MASNLFRAGAISCALLTTTALTAPAFAQTAEPAHRAMDANGVDLISGTFPLTLTEGTIGSGEGALSVVRHGNDAGGTGNWQNMYAFTSGSAVTVVLGDHSESFTSGGGGYVATQGNGATLTSPGAGAYTYTAADGTATTFGAAVGDQGGTSNMCGHVGADPNSCFVVAATITRPNAATISFSYDVHGNCSTVFNPDGSLDCSYSWRLDTVSNSYGYAIDFAYVTDSVTFHHNPSANWFKRNGAVLSNGGTTRTVSYNFISSTVTEVTDADGRVWRVTTGTNSLGIRRPGSSSDDVSVTFSGGIVTQVVRDGITTGYSRSVGGSTATTTITDALSHTATVIANTSIGRITSITDQLSHVTAYTYDGSGRMTRITQPEGNYTDYTYDGRGNLTETRLVGKSGSGVPDIVAGATYAASCTDPSCNQPLTTTDARGNVTDYTYSATHGGLLSVTGPAPSGGATRPEVRYSYTLTNGEYRVTGVSTCASGAAGGCVGTSDETRTVIAYDAGGNATSVERRSGNTSGGGALSATTTMTYDGVGNVLTVDGPLSGTADTTRYRYNSARQMVGVVGPDPDGGSALLHRAVRATYATDGQPTKVERGTVTSQSDGDWASMTVLEEVQSEYDSHHRPFVARLVSGGTVYALTQTSYDALGRVECVAQRMNDTQFATGSLPSDACTLDTQGSLGPDRITRRTYDYVSRPTLVQTGYAVSGVAADEVATAYTNNGRVSYVTDAEGNRTTNTYDGHDRVTRTAMPHPSTDNTSSSTDYEDLTYETRSGGTLGSPLVVNRRLRDNTNIVYAYDALGRLTSKDRPGSEPTVSYTYDLGGRMLTAGMTGHTLTFTYDALGRNLSQDGPLGTVSYAYDPAGRRTRLTYPGSGLYVDYDHLITGEISVIRENGATSGVGVLGTYTYDDRGRRTLLTRGNGATTAYTYDNVDRLTQLADNLSGSTYDQTLTFTRNPVGQIAGTTRSNDNHAWTNHYAVNRNYTANGLNQYTAAGAITPTYDARGNTQEAGGWQYYSYSSENMLTASWNETGLSYDPARRLWQIGASLTRMLYDGQTLIGEYNSAHVALRRYVHGPGVDEPLVRYDGTGTSTRTFYHADERGSIVATSDGSGAMANINTYDEYGIPGSGNTGTFQYTGQQWLSDIRMYHYRARIYSPTLGRFMQTDPIGYEDGMNIYTYVGNNPVNFRDPSGTDTCIATNYSWYTLGGEYLGPAGTEFEGCGMFSGGQPRTYGDFGGGGGGGGGDAPAPADPACTVPLVDRNWPVPPGFQPSPLYPTNTFVLDRGGTLVMNPNYNAARVAAGAPDGPAGWGDLLGPNPGSVLLDLAGISAMALVATIYPPAVLGQALGRTAVTGAAAAQSVNHTPPC